MCADYDRSVDDLTARANALRASPLAADVRAHRLIVILRRVAPRDRLLDLVDELLDAGARIVEITWDAPTAADDLAAVAAAVGSKAIVGAGTLRSPGAVAAAHAAGAAFGVAPILDPEVLRAALDRDLPFIPGAYTPTEVDAAWRAGATFVKLFPGSSLGPAHVRELRGPLPEVETIVTGGVDATNGPVFLAAGAVAVGVGGAIVNASPAERRALVAAITGNR
jgi:2-dehydro-3-deoxyphosphogluconate aldolase/(4S)-4-hydroxy-2-oxoglutarate aldolase